MKTITSKVTDKLIDRILSKIPESDFGTYNQMDPTHYSKGEVEVSYDTPKAPFLFRVSYNDMTWGVKIQVHKIDKFHDNLIIDFYYDYEDRKLCYHQKNSGGLKLLYRLEKLMPEVEDMFPNREEFNEEYEMPDCNPGGGAYYLES